MFRLSRIFLYFSLLTVVLIACQPTPVTPTPDMETMMEQAVQTAMAGMVTPTPLPTVTPLPTATMPPRTPPALPSIFTTGSLNPLDVPVTYEDDTCQYLLNKWNPNNAAPGTVVMTVMFHSITGGEATNVNQVSQKEFHLLMKDLNEMGFQAIDMQQMVDFMYNNTKIPQRSVLLIVDDRHFRQYFDENFFSYYQDWGWKVVNGWISAFGGEDNALVDNIALEKEGWVDHQAHGFIHNIPMSDSSTDEFLEGELLGAKDVFIAFYEKSPVAVIWPGGGFGARPVQAARQYGYELGFTINPRGPVMYNWVPQSTQKDSQRPSYIPEGPAGDPLMTLPRYWDTDARAHLDNVRRVGNEATAYAEQNKTTELEYYDIVCAPTYGPIPTAP